MTRKIFNATGIVVEKRDWKERDIVFTLLTSDDSKIEVLAKHAKKVPSRHNSGFDLFNGVTCQLYQGKFWPVVTQSQQILCFPGLTSTYEKIRAGFEVLDLLKKMILPHQSVRNLYQFLVKTLSFLDRVEDDYNGLILTAFQVKLLRMLGLFHTAPACEQCGKGFTATIWFSQFHYVCEGCTRYGAVELSQRITEYLVSFSENKFEDILLQEVPAAALGDTKTIIEQVITSQLPQKYSMV